MIDTLLSLLAPHLCSSCGRIGTLFCGNCKSYIIGWDMATCLLCEAQSEGKGDGLCILCHQIVTNVTVVGVRAGGLQRLIGGYKFKYMRAAASNLAELLVEKLPFLDMYTIIVPIPTSAAHARQRGFDHTKLLARHVAKRVRRPMRMVLGTRARHTQHHSSRQQRLENVKQAFFIQRPIDPERHYLIIDDVMTTGATMRQAIQCFRDAGARRISVAIIARQPSTDRLTSVKIGEVAA